MPRTYILDVVKYNQSTRHFQRLEKLRLKRICLKMRINQRQNSERFWVIPGIINQTDLDAL